MTARSLTIVDPAYESLGAASYAGRHALIPILAGLAAPLAAALLLAPGLLGSGRMVVQLVLVLILLVSGTVFVLTALGSGELVSATFDGTRREAEIVLAGAFAHKVLHVPFDHIRSIRTEVSRDDDGYCYQQAVIELHSGEVLALPDATTAAEVQAAAALLSGR